MYIAPPYHDTTNQLLYAILQHYENNPVPVTVPLPPYYTITNRLLYEILQNLGNPETPVEYLQFRVHYVSARYGNDETAEPNNIAKPYKTINAAKRNLFFGDMIHVLPGRYNEGNIFAACKMWFDLGAEVNYTGDGSIFQPSSGECFVRGYGIFRCTGSGNVIEAGSYINSVLDIECESFEAIETTVILWQNRMDTDPTNFKPHKIKAKRCYSQNGAAVHLHYNSHTWVEIEEISSDSDSMHSLYGTNPRKALVQNSRILSNHYGAVYMDALLFAEINNCKVVCNWDNSQGHGIEFSTIYDQVHIFNTSIDCTNADAFSIKTNTPLSLLLDNNVIASNEVDGDITYQRGTRVIVN